MKINVKNHIDDENLTKTQKIEKVLSNLQKAYIDELEDTKKKLDSLLQILKTNPELIKKNGK